MPLEDYFPRVARAKSEVYSLATTGNSLTRREEESAVKLQAVVRGNAARAEASDMKNGAGWFVFLCGVCGGPRKARKQGALAPHRRRDTSMPTLTAAGRLTCVTGPMPGTDPMAVGETPKEVAVVS